MTVVLKIQKARSFYGFAFFVDNNVRGQVGRKLK